MLTYIAQAPAADDPDAPRRADGHVRRHPVRAGRPGRPARRGDARRRRAAKAPRSGVGAAAAISTPSRSRRSRSSTASTSRRSRATSRCSASFARFDLGKSFMHNKDVWQLIKEKLPVSISLGLWTFLLTYLISIPLGVAKAVREGIALRHGRPRCSCWSGFALPGFALGVLLIVLFAGGTFLDWFPLRGLTSDNWASLSLARAHRRLPVAPGAAAHLLRDRQLRRRHDPDQEHVRRGDPQAVRAGRAREGLERAARAVQARVPQRADPDRHRLSGGVRRPRSSPARC